jgi:hypothetical protein
MNKIKLLVVVFGLVLVSSLTTEASDHKNIFRGTDPKWQSQSNWYSTRTGPNGLPDWRFQFEVDHFVPFFSPYQDREILQLGLFTTNSVVNYKNKTVTLWVGVDNRGKAKYITVQRIRCQYLFD